MNGDGWSVRRDRFGKEWYSANGGLTWYTWLAFDELQPERVYGEPQW